MLFLETLEKYNQEIQNVAEELFLAAFSNQTQDQDLLLVLENGFYDDEHITYLRSEKLSPYVIGPGREGHAEWTQFHFYDSYRRNVEGNRDEFIKNVRESEKVQDVENTSVHLELMIYLKFWEADSIIKKLYQIARLARGFPYDWHFKIESSGGRKQIFEKQIKETLKNGCPNFYAFMTETYSSQIRNAIAHSQYSFLSRNININNKHLSKNYHLNNLTFEEWEIIIHKVILFYNEFVGQINKYYTYYKNESLPKQYGLPLRITKHDGVEESRFYIYEKNRWCWYDNIRNK